MTICPQLLLAIVASSTGQIVSKPDRTGPDRTGPDRIGPDRTGPDRIGPDRIGPDRIGPDRIGPDRIGPDRLEYRNRGVFRRFPPAIEFLRHVLVFDLYGVAVGRQSYRYCHHRRRTPPPSLATSARQQTSRSAHESGYPDLSPANDPRIRFLRGVHPVVSALVPVDPAVVRDRAFSDESISISAVRRRMITVRVITWRGFFIVHDLRPP